MYHQVNLNLIRHTCKSKGYSMRYMAKCLDISGKSNYLSKIRHCEWKLNHHPKKVLSRRTPDEISFDKVLRLV